MKKHLLIGITISAFFLYLVFRKVNIEETIRVISSTNLVYIMLMLCLCIPTLMVRSVRWKAMLADYKKIPVIYFFESISIGAMTNNLLPFRIGDLAQVFFLGYKTNISKSTIFSTVVIERLCDFTAMGGIIICGSFFILLPEEMSREKIILFLSSITLFIILIFKLKIFFSLVVNKIVPLGGLRNRLQGIIERFYQGLASINNIHVITKLIFLTFVLWFLCSLGLYLCMCSVNIKSNIFIGAFILSLTGVASMIPSSPGYIGTLEFFITTGLGLSGVSKEYAVGFCIVYRIMGWFTSTFLGLIILLKNNLSIKEIVKMSKETLPARD